MVAYEVVEIESIIKIGVAPFLGALGSIYAENVGLIRERWVVQAQGRFHRLSRPILNKDREPVENFGNLKIVQNPLTIVRAFFSDNL